MAHKCFIRQASTVLHQQMPTQNSKDLVAKLHQQPGALATNQSTTSTPADPQKEMDLDRTYAKEGSEQHNTAALKWNPQGKRRRSRPRNTWQRSVEDEMSKTGHSWHTLDQMAKNRVRWTGIVSGLCSAQE